MYWIPLLYQQRSVAKPCQRNQQEENEQNKKYLQPKINIQRKENTSFLHFCFNFFVFFFASVFSKVNLIFWHRRKLKENNV